MKRLIVVSGALLLLAIASQHPAVAQRHHQPCDGEDSQRVFPPDRQVEPQGRPGAQRHYRSYHHLHPFPRYIYIYPPVHVWPYAYGYAPYYYQYPYIGPLYVPAGELYGPQALARFLGWNNFNAWDPAGGAVAPRENADRQQQAPEGNEAKKDRNLRGTNQKALALAWKFIGYGDAHFAAGKYSDALQRYRKAVGAAPQLAAGYFRQGYALMAAGRYELAAKTLKRGLALDPRWAASGFNNDELYGRDQLAKAAHLDAMTKAADAQPHDADLLFLLGVFSHFNGQPDRAAVFFRRAEQLVGPNDAHLRAFMAK